MRRRFLGGIKEKNNVIHYTSTDNLIIVPSRNNFGTIMINNEMSNNIGIMIFLADVTAIGEYTFNECGRLKSITIPNSVTLIGEGAFHGCDSLTSITIPDSVTLIEGYAFYRCESLTSVIIPDNVTTIRRATFYSCASLTSVTIPDSVNTIENGAFEGCSSITSITIPDGVTSIEMGAFRSCYSLTSVTIPDSVTTIGNSAFRYCRSLTSVTIGDSVTSIGDYAFYYCESLKTVYCKATTPPTLDETSVFDNNGSGRKIYVPYQSLDAYKTASRWSEYADDIVGYDFEKNLIYNKCVVEGNTVTFDYPVATPLTLYYTTNMGSTSDAVLKDKISKNITLGPGETLTSIDSISPTEDAIYVYAIVSNQNSGGG